MYDVAPMVEATTGLERGIASDLAQARSGAGDISVDLVALHAYYGKLVELDDELERQLHRFGSSDEADDGPGSGSAAPDGVTFAMAATRAAKNGDVSLLSSLRDTQMLLREHLEALRHNYNSYLAREGENLGRLNQAIPWADKPLGW